VDAKRARVVLCMIVKNEAAIVRRCLDAALPHVDGYVVCDTGSTDATVDVVRAAGDAHGVAGEVHADAWRDFGHNRTLAARRGREFAARRGWPLGATYLLLLDADMILHVDADHDRARLEAPVYDVAQDDGALRYYNIRLVRLDRAWRSVGVTHEYWQAVDGAPAPRHLDTMWIEDRGDGGSKADKFERDIRLLRDGLASEPDNRRYLFYLAQSYFDVGRFGEAHDAYERRWRAGGWDEERWYARYKQGLSLLRAGEAERGAGVLLAAFDERPTRAEPLHALAKHYRERGQNHLATMLALRGLAVPYPEGDILFVASGVYDWQLWEELAITAFYAGPEHHARGLEACERLLARRSDERQPALIEAVTYRYRGHSVADAGKVYRTPEEVASWRERDPIERYVDVLREHELLGDEELERLRAEVADEVSEAIRDAAAAPSPDPDELYENVYGGEVWREQFARMDTAAPFGERLETRSWRT